MRAIARRTLLSAGRRRALWSLAAVLGAMGCMPAREPAPDTVAGGHAAASSAASRFNSVDVTGAEWGRDFQLKDPQGRTRTLADFKGQAVVLFFGFTQCPDVCPTALSRAAAVMQQLGPASDRVQVIFATVDPERDTGPLLAEYTQAFHPRFLGLRADLATTEQTARAFKVFYRKVPTGSSYTMDHTALSFVFDPAGRLRLAVRHTTTADELAHDLRQLL